MRGGSKTQKRAKRTLKEALHIGNLRANGSHLTELDALGSRQVLMGLVRVRKKPAEGQSEP